VVTDLTVNVRLLTSLVSCLSTRLAAIFQVSCQSDERTLANSKGVSYLQEAPLQSE